MRQLLLVPVAWLLLSGAVELQLGPTEHGADRAPGTDEEQTAPSTGPSEQVARHHLRSAQGPEVERRVSALKRIARFEISGDAGKRSGSVNTADALLTLGLLHYHGVVVPYDADLARDLFFRAYSRGSAAASLAVAWCLADGCGAEPNKVALESALVRARKVNRGRAAYIAFLAAADEPGSESRARQFLETAVQRNDRYALNEMGLQMLRDDQPEEAVGFFRRALAAGSEVARHNLDLVTQRLQRTGSDKDLPVGASASSLFSRARQLHRNGQTAGDYNQALAYYQAAAAEGYEPAQQMLALILSRPSPTGGVNVVWMRQTANVSVGPAGKVVPQASPTFLKEASPITDLIPSVFLLRSAEGGR